MRRKILAGFLFLLVICSIALSLTPLLVEPASGQNCPHPGSPCPWAPQNNEYSGGLADPECCCKNNSGEIVC